MSENKRWLIGVGVTVGLAFLGSYGVAIMKIERLEAIVEERGARQERISEFLMRRFMGELEGRQ